MPKILANGIELYYEAQGSGETVLLVPPNWWPCATWNIGVVPWLSQHYRTLIYDGRGTGRSDKPADGYTVCQFAQDAIELLTTLGVKRCHAVGFAIGAQIMQAMAVERPDLVATLTMAASGPGKRRLDGGPRDVGSEALDEIQKIGFEKYIRTHVDNAVMAYNPDFYRNHRDVGAALAQALWSGQSTIEQYRVHELARLSWDTFEAAPKITVPTLILCGEDDGVERRGSTPASTAKRLAELVPGAELALVPKTRHMTFWDGTGALDALRDFLDRHPIEPK
jgi:pimeloyl-ACP methyl ester carboxylesterase